MQLKELNKWSGTGSENGLIAKFAELEKLIEELRKKEIPPDISELINQEIDAVNTFPGSNTDLMKRLKKSQLVILRLVEKELRLVPKDHYLRRGLAIGMCFGIPFGVAFGLNSMNMGFLGLGIPIGMGIGVAIGSGMDKKAFAEGRQLDLKIK